MPIYQFTCEQCGTQFDFLAKRLSERPEACPECGATRITKQLSTFSAKVPSGAGTDAPACQSGACGPSGTCPFA